MLCRSRKSFAFAAALIVALSQLTIASPLDEGIAAARDGNYGTALQLLHPLAKQGDPQAQYELGMILDRTGQAALGR
jgi:Flp pilus assembly protein TadD